MTRHHLALLSAALAAALYAVPAWANPGAGFTWSFQNTNFTTSASQQSAVAMRNGEAWPVVMVDNANGSYGAVTTLFPSGWKTISPGIYSSMPSRIRMVSSVDGRIAYTAGMGPTGLGGQVSAVTGGWSSLPTGTLAVAFDKTGTLYTATTTTVSNMPTITGMTGTIVDIATSAAGDIGVVTSDMKYYQYSAWTGSWMNSVLPEIMLTPDSMDLQFDSKSRPHIVGASFSSSIYGLDYSPVTGTWSSNLIASGIGGNPRLALAANSLGTVGTTWATNNSVYYAYKTDTGSWTSSMVIAETSSVFAGGIAYDYADLPVLSYTRIGGSTPGVVLAYDPVEAVPEAATVGLLALGSLGLLRRTSRR